MNATIKQREEKRSRCSRSKPAVDPRQLLGGGKQGNQEMFARVACDILMMTLSYIWIYILYDGDSADDTTGGGYDDQLINCDPRIILRPQLIPINQLSRPTETSERLISIHFNDDDVDCWWWWVGCMPHHLIGSLSSKLEWHSNLWKPFWTSRNVWQWRKATKAQTTVKEFSQCLSSPLQSHQWTAAHKINFAAGKFGWFVIGHLLRGSQCSL